LQNRDIKQLIQERVLVLDGAMGTQIQNLEIPDAAWEGNEGCNELLNVTFREGIAKIHEAYLKAGADIIKTNTFGAIPWVLEDYDIGEKTYALAKAGAQIVAEVCKKFSTPEKPRFVAGDLGPGTKLPSLGHIKYDEMYAGYRQAAEGLIDGGADLFLLETCQDPLQIKAALHACTDVGKEKGKALPIMVSVTIELAGSMLIGFLLSALAIRCMFKQTSAYAFFAPIALLAIPFIDTAAAIIRRRLMGRSIFAVDRGHLHHTLMKQGYSPRISLLWVALLCSTTAAGGVMSLIYQQSEYALVSIALVLIVMIGWRIEQH